MKKDGFKYFTAIIAMNIRWEGGGGEYIANKIFLTPFGIAMKRSRGSNISQPLFFEPPLKRELEIGDWLKISWS